MAVTVNGGAPSAPQIAEFKSVFDLLGLSTAALSVKANATNATAAATDVAAGTDGHVLRRSGTTLGFGTLATAGYGDATVTLAKMANLAQDQVIGRVTASTGVPETFTVTAAARSVLDDTTVAAMMDTLGGGTVSNTEFQYLNGVTSAIQTQIDAKLDAAIATVITDTKAVPIGADKAIILDSAASDAPKLTTVNGIRTTPPGTGLGTTGTVNLDFAADVGLPQNITLTGNITLTTSNLVAGRSKTLRITGGGSTYTITYPAWVAFGAALPTSLATGDVLIIALFANSTTDASVDAAAALSV